MTKAHLRIFIVGPTFAHNASLSRPAAEGGIAANGPTAPAAGEDPQGRLQALVGGAATGALAESLGALAAEDPHWRFGTCAAAEHEPPSVGAERPPKPPFHFWAPFTPVMRWRLLLSEADGLFELGWA
jgi:hypothetical protein